MEIIIERQLTRIERVALIWKAFEELEEHGYGELKVQFNNNQAIGFSIDKGTRFGLASPEWYANP